MKGIIVLGGHIQALGICRVLGQYGIPIVVVDETKNNIARHSKYCVKFLLTEKHDLVSMLLSRTMLGSFSGWLVMPTNDKHVKLLSENKQELSRFYSVVVDDWEKVQNFYYKSMSYPLIEGLGIPAPKTIVPKNIEHLEQLADHLLYPLIIKPSVMIDFYQLYHKKAILCEDKPTLIKTVREVLNDITISDLLVQELIPGDSYNQYSVGLFAIEGEIKECVIARRSRQHPIDFGNATTYAETVDVRLLKEYAAIIMRRTKYNGLAEVEFKFDTRDGLYKFLEVNPRTWKWHSLAKSANIPILETMYTHHTGENLDTQGVKMQATWQDLITDIPTIFNLMMHGIPFQSKLFSRNQAVASLADAKPFIMQLLYIPYLFATRR